MLPEEDASSSWEIRSPQGSSGDYTWRYRLWDEYQSTDPGYTFVGPRTDLYDNVNSQYGSQHYAASFVGKAHGAKWGGSFVNEGPLIDSQISSSNPTILVELYGSNDLAYLSSPSAAIADAREFIADARAAQPGIDIVMGQVLTKWDPWSGSINLDSQSADYNARLATLAAEVNTTSERVVIARTRSGWDPREHTWDGTHPNPTGESLIGQRVAEALHSFGIGVASPNIYGAKSWNVAGSAVGVNPGAEKAALTWNRVPSGSTGMFVEQRRSGSGSFDRLPYAVSGNGWTAGGLVPGVNWEFRVVANKGFMTGLPGPGSSSAYISAEPFDAVSNVLASATGTSTAFANWPTASNAAGYKLSYRAAINQSQGWVDLPYAITATEFDFGLLAQGRRYSFGVRSVRGEVEKARTASGLARTYGISGSRLYAALGDSYSSGLGASGDESGGGCHRNVDAWAFDMQSDWNANTRLIACAGNVTSDVNGTQFSSAQAYYGSAGMGPQLITLTIGGNDVGFSPMLEQCVRGDCTATEAAVRADIDALRATLVSVYSRYRNEYPGADIVVGGYPGLLEVGGNAPDPACLRLSDAEREMANRLAYRLNNVISSAAVEAGVWPIGQRAYDAFAAGHNACAFSNDWIVNPDWEIGGEVNGFLSPKSFHPNNAGQLAMSIAFSNAIIFQANP